jgi:hypothetical protein
VRLFLKNPGLNPRLGYFFVGDNSDDGFIVAIVFALADTKYPDDLIRFKKTSKSVSS